MSWPEAAIQITSLVMNTLSLVGLAYIAAMQKR